MTSPDDMVPATSGRSSKPTSMARPPAASSCMNWALVALVAVIFKFWRRLESLAEVNRRRS